MKFHINEADGNVYYFDGGWLMAAPLSNDNTFDTVEGADCYLTQEFTEEDVLILSKHLGCSTEQIKLTLSYLNEKSMNPKR